MNSPKLIRLRTGAATTTATGQQDRWQNGMLAFSCTATCFLAVKAVLPILTGGLIDGALLFLIAVASASLMAVAAYKVVRAGEALGGGGGGGAGAVAAAGLGRASMEQGFLALARGEGATSGFSA